MQIPQIPNIDRSFYQNSSSLKEKRSNNFPSLLLLPPLFEKLISISTPHWPFYFSIERPSKLWQSLPIGLKKANHFLFVACCRAEEENEAKTGTILEKALEVDANDNYICFSLEDSNFDEDGFFNKDKNNNHWEDIADGS